jgi:hypothetical protein
VSSSLRITRLILVLINIEIQSITVGSGGVRYIYRIYKIPVASIGVPCDIVKLDSILSGASQRSHLLQGQRFLGLGSSCASDKCQT